MTANEFHTYSVPYYARHKRKIILKPIAGVFYPSSLLLGERIPSELLSSMQYRARRSASQVLLAGASCTNLSSDMACLTSVMVGAGGMQRVEEVERASDQ